MLSFNAVALKSPLIKKFALLDFFKILKGLLKRFWIF